MLILNICIGIFILISPCSSLSMKMEILNNSPEFDNDNINIFDVYDSSYTAFDICEFHYSFKFNVIYLDEDDKLIKEISTEEEKTKEDNEENKDKDKNIDKGKEKLAIVDNIRYKPAEKGETFESRHKGKFMDRYFSDLYKKMSS
jgi:hypothetical protein